jgi:hypothetical protein
LKALERTIAGFVQHCDAACAGGPAPDCVILEDLTKPAPLSVARRERPRVGA